MGDASGVGEVGASALEEFPPGPGIQSSQPALLATHAATQKVRTGRPLPRHPGPRAELERDNRKAVKIAE